MPTIDLLTRLICPDASLPISMEPERPYAATSPPLPPNPPRAVIDGTSYPHIVESIIRSAAAEASDLELTRMRTVSKEWRGCIDSILGRHLVLDAYFSRGNAATYLHDGIRAPIASDIHAYHFLASTKRPFEVPAIAAPVLAHTQVLDILNLSRINALTSLMPLLPVLDTLRLYPQQAGPWFTHPKTPFSWMCAYDQQPFLCRHAPPAMPAARRVVAFLDLTSYRPTESRWYEVPGEVPDMEHLVLHFYPLHPGLPLAHWYKQFGLLHFLPRRVTVIFRDDGPAAPGLWPRPNPAESLAELVAQLPENTGVTVVGFEVIAEHPDFDRDEVAHDVAGHSGLQHLVFVNLRTYKEQVGAATWALYSERAQERPMPSDVKPVG